MTTNVNTSRTDEESAAIAEGLEALRQALTEAGMAYAIDRCAEEYARMLDATRRVADAAGLGGSDRRAYLAHMDTRTRADVLAEAERRRDERVLLAQRQLVEWRRTAGARVRSLPQSLHQFDEDR